MADDAHNAYFLNDEERELVVARRKAQVGLSETFEWADARKGMGTRKSIGTHRPNFSDC